MYDGQSGNRAASVSRHIPRWRRVVGRRRRRVIVRRGIVGWWRVIHWRRIIDGRGHINRRQANKHAATAPAATPAAAPAAPTTAIPATTAVPTTPTTVPTTPATVPTAPTTMPTTSATVPAAPATPAALPRGVGRRHGERKHSETNRCCQQVAGRAERRPKAAHGRYPQTDPHVTPNSLPRPFNLRADRRHRGIPATRRVRDTAPQIASPMVACP
jgi:hypothetical protein